MEKHCRSDPIRWVPVMNWSKIKFLEMVVAVLLPLAPISARADNEVLTFRQNASGQVEAVVSGLITNQCGFRFLPATSIAIGASTIAIASPDVAPLPCSTPIVPPQPYEVVAGLGGLVAPSYAVTWTQGTVVLAAQLTPAALSPPAIPTLGLPGLVLMALALAVAAGARVSKGRG